MEFGEGLRILMSLAMVVPMLAARISALRPYARRIWQATAVIYILGGGGAILWRFVIRDWVTGG